MGESQAKLETKDWDPPNLDSSDECEQSKCKRFIQVLERDCVLIVCVGTKSFAEDMDMQEGGGTEDGAMRMGRD